MLILERKSNEGLVIFNAKTGEYIDIEVKLAPNRKTAKIKIEAQPHYKIWRKELEGSEKQKRMSGMTASCDQTRSMY